jgi:phasin family protein
MTTTKKSAPKAAAKVTPAPKMVENAVAVSKETVENVVKVSTEAATKGVEKAVAASQENVAAAVKAGTDAFKGYEEVISFGKANVDAVVKANELFVKGMQSLNKEIFAIAQATLEGNAEVTKKVLSCASVQDAVTMQNDLVKANYEKAMSEGRKITDMTVKLAQDASAPITKRVNVTVEKITKELAA